ncbi:MAG: replication-associated recombination protein A [Chloroflexi bacterium]|nr:replication-associated recombination protein A [Chloroflexota bacterium]
MTPTGSRTPPPADAGMPLAARMRPRALDEFVGQEHLLGPGHVLRRIVETGRLGSLILWGPPGVGKTTLANLLASATGGTVHHLSAVTAGVADLRKLVAEAGQSPRGSLALVLDEVHRWSKTQQDALLPAVEDGRLVLIGLTTENPYFDLVPALRSRLRILRLEPLTPDQVRALLERALADPERGLGALALTIAPAALDLLVEASGGDARTALNGLEAAAALAATPPGASPDLNSPTPDPRPPAPITVEIVSEAIQRRALRYDRAGDDHYQTISAFIKSIRGSDPDAAIFWLAKMLAAGEDPRFIARRLTIAASEDIGNADPVGLMLAMNAYQAVERVGMPEAGIILAHAVTYCASAPKSNAAYLALLAAQRAIEAGANLEVPLHLRNASFGGAKALGYGRGYDYAHDFAEGDPRRYRQRHLPEGVSGPFYEPTMHGRERAIKERLDDIRRIRQLAP